MERPYPLSSVLRMRSDEVDDESGYGAFTDALRGDVVDRAHAASRQTAVGDLHWVLGQIREPLAAERTGLADPSAARQLMEGVAAARRRLADLKRADAAWSARLDDEFGALRTRVAFEFQREMRAILRDAQAEVEERNPAGSWPRSARSCRTDRHRGPGGVPGRRRPVPGMSRGPSPRCSPTRRHDRGRSHRR